MNKRRIALLAGLMTMGMVSFAVESSKSEVLTKEQKPLSIFNINDRVRFDENRLEINGNLHLNKNNRLEMRLRNYNGVSDTFGADTGDGTGKSATTDGTEIRLRLFTQTSIDNLEVRTELQTNSNKDSQNEQYFRVQPTYYFYNTNDSYALVRAGFAYDHQDDKSDAYSFSSSTENFYTINDYLAIEGNIYYDYTFATDSNKFNNVDIEAYAYANYPLYEANDFKVEALFEGGMDPYSFGSRHFGDLNDVTKDKDNNNNHETYVLYAEPSIKASKKLNENNSIYLQAGYYIESTEANNDSYKGDTTDDYNDTGFVRVGFTAAF
uniref:Porin n=1 Tax=Hirondellea gigas TaxID=1518452 RepID=A0A6A7FYT1_9CRUS